MQTCEEIAKRYNINVLELGADRDHMHFLIQSVPDTAPADIIRIISRTGCEEQGKNYVKGQGEEYHRLYRGQLKMFE